MNKILLLLFLFLPTFSFAESFTDVYTGMTFEIPEGFYYDESKSNGDLQKRNWWYAFSDKEGSLLVVEIDEYPRVCSLPEHFHSSLTEDSEFDSVIYAGMEFKNFLLDDFEVTKCQLSILAVAENTVEPLYFCDYLFVKEQFGFSMSLMASEKSPETHKRREELMFSLIRSVRFSQ